MKPLDLDKEEYRKILYKVSDSIVDLYSNIRDKNVYHGKTSKEIRTLFDEPLPEKGQNLDTLIDVINEKIYPHVALHFSPNFYAWVSSCATQAGIIGEIMSTAINVNATTWMNAAAASEIEKNVTQWIGEFIGYPTDGGVFLSGGSTANLTGLAVARNVIAEKTNNQNPNSKLVYYTSRQVHYSIDKSMKLLGLNQENLKKLPVDEFYKIDVSRLRNQINEDIKNGLIPCCIIGNAGTVNTGAIDNLKELAKICKEFDMWYHIDAAYGGFAAATSYQKQDFEGLELADSLAVDLHKWLFTPFETGCILLKDKENLKKTFSHIPDYQSFQEIESENINFSEYSFQQSRNFKALKAWLTFKSYGAQALRVNVGKSIENMRYLANVLESTEDFTLSAPQSLSIVCFQYISKESAIRNNSFLVNEVNRRIVKQLESDTRIFIRPTQLNNKVVLRACCTNFRRNEGDIDYLVRVIREIGNEEREKILPKFRFY